MNRTSTRREYTNNGYIQPTIQIEELFASKGRVKIIKILVDEGELNISEIGRRAGVNYTATVQHLEFLCKIGIVQEKNFGRIRIYRLKEEDIRVRALRSFFSLWYNQ